jgi:metal-responsive CopG/Arc/MetJ family transcriptional regulator
LTRRNPPRSKQDRPPISFRTHRSILVRLDKLAKKFNVTRNELIERVLIMYLGERGDDVETMMIQAQEAEDEAVDLFA